MQRRQALEEVALQVLALPARLPALPPLLPPGRAQRDVVRQQDARAGSLGSFCPRENHSHLDGQRR